MKIPLLLLLLSAQSCSGATDSYPPAHNLTWTSINFKTLLSWAPKPSADYSYTVEFSVSGGDRQRIHQCIRSNATECDLSRSLTELKSCYTADVLSEPPLGTTSDLTEFPHSTSPRFCPYQDTDIGRPDFSLNVSQDQQTTTLYVSDPPTALFIGDRQLNIRDVFADDLRYRVKYRKKKSSGIKTLDSGFSVIPMSSLDRGESYCFTVQAYIPSRRTAKQFGEESATKCSGGEERSIFKVFSPAVIAGGLLLIPLTLGLIVTVICWKRKRKAAKAGMERRPLRDA
ncbi:coagulation factor IIIa [Cyprinodon tularosa]|uniref:coagulation factor IIIa n=1 Tax=Cyprinodon tularosa TaxID=77115 RepID=UPI0018E1E894|nr:coagulation factor IIIa [Cyprinodon tularosa]